MATTDMITRYESAFGQVELSPEIVNKYLARGNKLTEQEIMLFIQLCKYQKLNPFVNEAYPIKFGEEFQMVVGYQAYTRRAEENPNYLSRSSGIVVSRTVNGAIEIAKKEGTCVYPGEELIGGWCAVRYLRNGEEQTAYKEVGLKEYIKTTKDGKPNRQWATAPATMIEKVAVSQALRAAFPKDYEGLYTQDEIKAIEATYQEIPVPETDQLATKEDRQTLLGVAKEKYGKAFNEKLKEIYTECGIESSQTMTKSQLSAAIDYVNADEVKPAQSPEQSADAKVEQAKLEV